MSRASDNEALYVVANAIRDRCLAVDDSLFTPGASIWAETTSDEVARAVAQDDTSGRDFAEKLSDHLASLSPAAVQLGAEILYVVLLPESDTGVDRKAEHVERILALLPDGVTMPEELRLALGQGFAKYGQGGRAHRHEAVRYLARFAREWKRTGSDERGTLLEDPWAFRQFVSNVQSERADTERSALLHLIFPDEFEPIVSQRMKTKIAAGFPELVKEPDSPLDRRLADIRAALEPQHGPGFDFWKEDLKAVWDPDDASSSDDDANGGGRIGQQAVEAAIRALASTKLKPASESMLRVFLAFKAIHRDGSTDAVTGPDIERVVKELFTLIPTPPDTADNKMSGTIRLRGTGTGRPDWMRNDSYRGAFQNNAGPKGAARVMFVDDDWHKPLRGEALDSVVASLDSTRNAWPPRDAIAAIAVRDEIFDPRASWAVVEAAARTKFGVSEDEWEALTAPASLSGGPFDGKPWNPVDLSPDLRPPGAEHVRQSEQQIEELPERLAKEVERVVDALSSYGRHAIVALVGVPGTSKSHVARLAARAFASEGCLREIQFSPSYTYEEFMEGPRYAEGMRVKIVPGAFLELNARAAGDPGSQYVLLIEELTRADVPRVLGELLTFIEYREEADVFSTLYSRDEVTRIAPNVAILATYNPIDRSAINVDAALIRRLRILDFPPDMALLREILNDNGVDSLVIDRLVEMFKACREVTPERFEETMPFGHAIFASVSSEADLFTLWHQTIKHILVRPHAGRNELYPTIAEHYPWRESANVSVVQGEGAARAPRGDPVPAEAGERAETDEGDSDQQA
jgi:5-methylcytosine-specific restriction protein B